MITLNAARAMNVNDHSLKLGNPANLIVVSAPNVLEALREHEAPRCVISHGKWIDRAWMKTVAATGEW